jgi:hypothetical protein
MLIHICVCYITNMKNYMIHTFYDILIVYLNDLIKPSSILVANSLTS